MLSSTSTPAQQNETPAINLSDEEWRQRLNPEAYEILRRHATEHAFTGKYWDIKSDDGVFQCAGCNAPLFEMKTKFRSASGWPSFYSPIAGAVVERRELSYLGTRTEVSCKQCGGHLGHVFSDGPGPTFQRYCINSGALDFSDDASQDGGALSLSSSNANTST
ncbi:peptide methionine sulfoxide reductase msrB [Cladochytrium replicatum]|nr:peptide methionine sulfoxide reductase msrB [Cladochytrium replicatum]